MVTLSGDAAAAAAAADAPNTGGDLLNVGLKQAMQDISQRISHRMITKDNTKIRVLNEANSAIELLEAVKKLADEMS